MSGVVRDAAIIVSEEDGTARRLPISVRQLILAAEQRAQSSQTATAEAVDLELRAAIGKSGVSVNPARLNAAVQSLNTMRKSANYKQLEIPLSAMPSRNTPIAAPIAAPPDNVFEPERKYPDREAAALYDRLAGIDEQKAALREELTLSIAPTQVIEWSKRHHGSAGSTALLTAHRQRIPLVVLRGDVGTGKTALAETIGAALVRDGIAKDVRLLKLTGQVRGKGLVGMVSDQINGAFQYAEARAAQLGSDVPLILLVDEADAIASSRAGDQQHHEDKAGVDALIQSLDRLKILSPRPIVIFITNLAGDIDPAIARRAGLVLRFERPTSAARAAIFHSLLDEYRFTQSDIDRLVHTSERKPLPFTASDLVDRITLRALRLAVRENKKLTAELVLKAIVETEPTPAFAQ